MPTISMDALVRALVRQDQNRAPEMAARASRTGALIRGLKRMHQLKMEGIRLYQPLPHIEPFHACTAKWRVIDGGNRSSKTFSCAAESVRAWLGCDPYDKYVRRGGRSLVIAKEMDDLARIWRTCAVEGEFKIIQDEHTKLWRAVRPDARDPSRLDPYDAAYKEKWKDAPPLIPQRMIRKIAWEEKAKRIPRVVWFDSGWNVLFRSSKGEAPQGEHYHHGLIDEQIENEEFFQELNRGLVGISESPQHLPKAVWSATSQSTNLQLWDLRQAADRGSEHVKAFATTIEQNPFISPEEREAFWQTLDEDERAVRYYGIYAIVTKRIYGMYDPMGAHGCEPFVVSPSEYARFVVLDPGRDHCGTLFLAVDEDGQHVYVYDGFDLRQGAAAQWAHEVAKRQGGYRFEAMVIDKQAGQQTGMGSDTSVARMYFEAAKEAGVVPRLSGEWGGFFPGSNDVEGRTEALISWMTPREIGPFAGTCRLQVHRGAVPKLDTQIRNAHTDPKRDNKRDLKVQQDVLVCLEYAASYDPQYSPPVPVDASVSKAGGLTVVERLKQKQRRQRQQRAAGVLY